MDIHRARFVPYPTPSITALSFTRPHDLHQPNPPPLRLAVGREDGTIEIWNPNHGSWLQETVLHGEGNGIDGLAWTQDPDEDGGGVVGQMRLFSIASSAAVTEWDVARGGVKRRSTGNFGEIWSLAAQPKREGEWQDLVVGCADGSVAVLSTTGGDLQFKRFLARVSSRKARCMCITWQTKDVVLAGFEDSVVRAYDARSGSLLRSMSFGVGLPGAPRNILIWKIHCLPSGDIVTADSNGEVRFWDGKMYALRQRIKAHDTDCLDLTCNAKGDTIMSASIDGKLSVLRQTKLGQKTTWAKSNGRRLHRGEFKAMASYDGSRLSVMVSGGSGAAPIAMPLREFGRENPRSLPFLPSTTPVTSAPKARVLVSWWNKDILLWRIARTGIEEGSENAKPHKLIARMTLDLRQNIRSVAISSDGKTLAAGDSDEVKLFQMRQSPHKDELSFRKIALPQEYAKLGARSLTISPDGKWLVVITPDSEMHVARIAQSPDHPKLLLVLSDTIELERHHRKAPQSSAYRIYERAITKTAFCPDSTILAVTDQSGYIDSWILQGHEDLTAPAIDKAHAEKKATSSDRGSDSDSDSDSSDDDDDERTFYGQTWADNPSSHLLPKLESAALVFTFRPTKRATEINGNPGVHATRHNPHAHSHEYAGGQGRLWILTAKHQMWEMDVLAGKLSDWSRRNPTTCLPEEFRKILDRAVGGVWDTKTGDERLWIYGHSWIFMLNVSKDVDSRGLDVPAKKRKRKHGGGVDDAEKRVKTLSSGAGGKVVPKEQLGSSREMQRFDGEKIAKVELGGRKRDEDDDEEDDDFGFLGAPDKSQEEGDAESSSLTRGEARTGEITRGKDKKRATWWSTFRYRPILGIVPLEADDEHVGEVPRPLEVVIVERPQKQE